MNYHLHYEKLIERARGRTLAGYVERHHVLPRCLGGGDDPSNIVTLTAEEHYLAHQLLVKIHPGVRGLIAATIMMSRNCNGNKAYGWLRRKFAECQRGKKLGPHSDEHKAKIGAAHKGRSRSFALRDRISETLKGRKLSDEHRKNIGEGQKGHKRRLGSKHSIETKAKMRAAHLGIPKPPRTKEHSEKLAAANIGNKNRVGKKHTEDAKRLMRASRLAYLYLKNIEQASNG